MTLGQCPAAADHISADTFLKPQALSFEQHFPEELCPTLKIIQRDSEVLAADQTAVLGAVEGKPSVRSQQSGVSNGK